MYNNLYERVKASYEYFIPYMSLNGQTVYADKALYDKFMSYGMLSQTESHERSNTAATKALMEA